MLLGVSVADDAMHTERIEAKIDTGCDFCAIPHGLYKKLTLLGVQEGEAEGSGGAYRTDIFRIRVLLPIEGTTWLPTKCIVTYGRYPLIGRSILNKLVLVASAMDNKFDLYPWSEEPPTGETV